MTTTKDANVAELDHKCSRSLEPHEFQIILVPGYSMLSLISALETLQNANLCSRAKLYSWRFFSLEENPKSSLDNRPFECSALNDCSSPRDVVVVGGAKLQDLNNRKLSIWLSRHIRGEIRITGLTTGAFAIADAGLLRERSSALHWQYRDAFSEMFNDASLSNRPFLSTGSRCSSSGGISAIDLFLDFIEQDHGSVFANQVAESMNYVTIRQAHQIATSEATAHLRIKNTHLRTALTIMEENLESPLSTIEIAENVGVSARQMERLFRRFTGLTPKQYYMHLRLRRAYFLVTQTEMRVVDISMACGFNSCSHFANCFRDEYGQTPAKVISGNIHQ